MGEETKSFDSHVIENELTDKELKDTRSKSWFLVYANPQENYKDDAGNALDPQTVCETMVHQWCGNDDRRSAIAAYCISADGFIHCHLCVCSTDAERFSAVKKVFPKAHLKASKGTKAQIEDYIYKRGKYEEKGEKILATARHGEIIGRQGQRNDLKNIASLLDSGYTPDQIMNSNFAYRKYDKMIKDAFFAKKQKEAPLCREIKVYWHVGDSGSGKSYEYVKLCEKYGREHVYTVNNYDTGKFDFYKGEEILVLDEFKGHIHFSELLTILDRYPHQIHCRFSNSYMLWNEVHITSIFTPEQVFRLMSIADRENDVYAQLARRIDFIVYHWIDKEGGYRQLTYPFKSYTDMSGLKYLASIEDGSLSPHDISSGFEPVQLELAFT